MILACVVFCTIAALIFGTIFTRPRMQAFAPLISHARLGPLNWIPNLECLRFEHGTDIKTGLMRYLKLAIAWENAVFSNNGRLILQDPAYQYLISEASDQEEAASRFATESNICDTFSVASSSNSSEILPKVEKLHMQPESQSVEFGDQAIFEVHPNEPAYSNLIADNQPGSGASPEMRYYTLMQEDVQHYTSQIARLRHVRAHEPYPTKFSKEEQARHEQGLEALQARLTSAQQALRLAESCLDPEWGPSDYPQGLLVDSIEERNLKAKENDVFSERETMSSAPLVLSSVQTIQRSKRPSNKEDDDPRSHRSISCSQDWVKEWLDGVSSNDAARGLTEEAQIGDSGLFHEATTM